MCLTYTACKDLSALHSNGDIVMKYMYNEPYSTIDRW